MWLGCEGGAPTDGVIIGVDGKVWELVMLVKKLVCGARERRGCAETSSIKKKKTCIVPA